MTAMNLLLMKSILSFICLILYLCLIMVMRSRCPSKHLLVVTCSRRFFFCWSSSFNISLWFRIVETSSRLSKRTEVFQRAGYFLFVVLPFKACAFSPSSWLAITVLGLNGKYYTGPRDDVTASARVSCPPV